MSTETRDRIAVRMDQETSRRLEQWYLADNCKSKNEFILKAMNFYPPDKTLSQCDWLVTFINCT